MTQWGSGWPADYGSFEPFGAPQAPPPPPEPPRSGWPVAALVAAVCAFAVAFFPVGLGFVAVPLGLFGIVAGVVGIRAAQRQGRGAAVAITGIVVSVSAMALAAVMFFVFYRSPSAPPVAAEPTPTSAAPRAADVIPEYNDDVQSVLKDEVEVSFGPYSDDGGVTDAQNPMAEMTVVSKRDITRSCHFTVRAVDSSGAEIYNGLAVSMTLTPGTTARQNVFRALISNSIPRTTADRLRNGTFEVTKASCM
ncbi:hypothetical protein [Mycolicibacterium sp.]|uniref:hypothetical protein n=1 Tax=Mycolicibacterium sp. TaxID=2320850 RepID=UPI0037C5956E